ncbi:hypothetical protein EAG_15224 [Camponotus floridanus]|uniref:Uncharacterized protein n=1 Tax=Camponotus floridanus TaxID=104421 RepID=E2A2X2_CAMFO|nr:hypothetical protein EAG_15224 [Camponotus floridanus]
MVLYGGLAVAATGGSAMHATSPTKAELGQERMNVARFSRSFDFSHPASLFFSVCLPLSLSPSRAITTLHIATPSTVELPRTATNDLERVAVSLPDSTISATNAAVTSGSVPIATSTPVNPAAGPLSPPPLTLAAGQGPHPHEHPPGAAPTVKVTSYPAVLKGRSAASPPNPNLVPSGKVPPPVPPRGTGPSRTGRSSEEHRTAGATASTTSSVTSSRGDEAAIITRYRLHDSSCDLHRPLPPDLPSTSSATTANTVTSTITAATSTKTIAISNALHARTSTLDTYRVTHHDSFDRETGSDDRPMDWYIQDLNEEFVSVEKVEDAYFIKTSPHPFRPDRGIYRSDRWREFGGAGNRKVPRRDKERRDSIKMDRLAKFTYFLNPSSRGDLMDYKMSRKDKKHSETYYERMKRKQKDLEASITTITTMSYRRGTLPSTCSTPPPPFDDAVRSNDQTLASGGHLQQGGATILASSLSSAHTKQNKVVHHVTLTKTYHDTVSISDVHLESSGSGSGSGGRETKSSLSVESGGSSRGGGCLTWTPPAGSAEGSTPTWTEGTPSFTESSSSGDIGCPTTPIKGNQRQDDGGRIAATVEEALASLTTEMRRTSQDGQHQLQQSASFSFYRQIRTSLKRDNSNHVAIMRNMQRALNVRRQAP